MWPGEIPNHSGMDMTEEFLRLNQGGQNTVHSQLHSVQQQPMHGRQHPQVNPAAAAAPMLQVPQSFKTKTMCAWRTEVYFIEVSRVSSAASGKQCATATRFAMQSSA
jgi:hypothetical protein